MRGARKNRLWIEDFRATTQIALGQTRSAEVERLLGAQVEFLRATLTRQSLKLAFAGLRTTCQTVALGFLVFLTGAGGAALRPRPIAFASCEREAA